MQIRRKSFDLQINILNAISSEIIKHGIIIHFKFDYVKSYLVYNIKRHSFLWRRILLIYEILRELDKRGSQTFLQSEPNS